MILLNDKNTLDTLNRKTTVEVLEEFLGEDAAVTIDNGLISGLLLNTVK